MPVPPNAVLTLSANNGSMPPRYHRWARLTLDARGEGTLEARRGYGDDGDGTVAPIRLGLEAAAALFSDLEALGLFSTDWAEPEGPPRVGGPLTWLRVEGGGLEVAVPPHVAAGQRDAKDAAVARVEAAVGRRVRPR